MGDMMQNDTIKQEPMEGVEAKESESPSENTGPIKCSECSQVYAGPSSLKRHLWRIHRLAGEEAQTLVDQSVSAAEGEEEPKEATEEQEEPQADSDTSTSSASQVKPLLAVSLSSTPKVRPLLSLSPEPPGYQANNFGGISPTAPWSHQAACGGASSVPQSGLLPTPGCQGGGGGMAPHSTGFVPEPADPQASDVTSSSAEAGDGKIKPLMAVDVMGGEQGIPSLMSLPFMGGSPYMYSGGMGGGYHSRGRRKERRSKPYTKDRHDGGDQTNNSGQQEAGDGGQEDRAEAESCGQCGAEFEDSADLADHEIGSHNVAIDLNCDVELTA